MTHNVLMSLARTNILDVKCEDSLRKPPKDWGRVGSLIPAKFLVFKITVGPSCSCIDECIFLFLFAIVDEQLRTKMQLLTACPTNFFIEICIFNT